MAASTYRDIIAAIKKKEFTPVYVLHGAEPWYLDLITDALEKNVVDPSDHDFNLTTLYGAETRVDQIAAAAQRFPMMAPHQLVVVKEAQAMQNAVQQLDQLETYIKRPAMTTVLVLVYKGKDLPATSRLIKATRNNPHVTLFHSPAVPEYRLAGVVKEYCRDRRLNIDEKAVGMLCEYVGSSLSRLFGEIDKLVVASGTKQPRITPVMVEANIGMSKDYNNFELTDAVGDRDYTKAVRIINHFADNPGKNPTTMISASLFSLFSRLIVANTTSDRSETGLAKIFNVKSTNQFAIRKALERRIRQMQAYNANQCMRAIRMLRDFDTRSKGIDSTTDEFSLLRELIFNLISI